MKQKNKEQEMKRKPLILHLIFTLLFISACSDPKPINYTSSLGRFSVIVPAPLEESSTTIDSPAGEIVMHSFMLEKKGYGYGVMYFDVPDGIKTNSNIEEMLDNSRDGAVRNVKGTLISEEKIIFNGYPGRKIVVGSSESDMIFRAKLIAVASRLYIIIVASDSKKDNLSPIEEFFNSFKLI